MRKIILFALLIVGFFGTSKSFAQGDGTPFLGQILPVSFNFAPNGWAQCNGQLLPISQNQALFFLLGTQYGGNGITNFALPDLRGRAIVGQGSGYVVGQSAGSENNTLTISNLPAHLHTVPATTNAGNSTTPTGNIMADTGAIDKEYSSNPTTQMAPTGSSGNSQPMNNMQPSAPVFYIIALQGIFPSQN